MRIDTRTKNDVEILDLQGRLSHAGGDVLLRRQLLDSLDNGHKKILVNLGGVRVVDSSGLGELIRCQVTCRRHGAEIKLLNVDMKVYELLTMTRLVGVFDIFDDENAAVRSFER